MRSRLLGAAVAAALVPLTAVPLAGSPSAAAESPGDPGRSPGLAWGACRTAELQTIGAECAYVRVPLNYSRPGGRTIRIAVSRVRHRSSAAKYQGVMLVNPGGPGGAGLSMAGTGDYLPARIAGTYDWIGFDPRGVGESRPAISCDPNYFSFDRPNYYPKPVANQDAWLKRSKDYADACKRNGPILRHMTTVDAARDMESIRRALGVSTINYFGFSYGTYLGQVYSTLFPKRIRRQVLDSNVNPHRVFYQANLDQDKSFQRAFELWFDWIATNDDTYHLGSTGKEVNDRFSSIQNQLADKPAGGKVGPSEWIDIFQTAAYSTFSWTDLASKFSRFSRNGNPAPLITAFETGGDFGDDNGFAVYNAVQCTDAQWPKQWSVWQRDNWATYDTAPLMTWPNAWFNAPCLFWPAKARNRFAVSGRKAPKTLLVGGTEDAATPFEGSLAVRQLFPRSRLIAIDGEVSHATSLDGNPCVARLLNAYLASGRLPKRRSGNRADAVCPRQNLPEPGGQMIAGLSLPPGAPLTRLP